MVCSQQYFFSMSCAMKTIYSEGRGNYVSPRHSSFVPPHFLLSTNLAPSLKFQTFAYLKKKNAAYFFATGGGYDKLEVYECSDGVKAPAVTGEMMIRFPSCMVSWRHKEFHMVIQMLHLNLLLVCTLELSTATELVTWLVSIWGGWWLKGNRSGKLSFCM